MSPWIQSTFCLIELMIKCILQYRNYTQNYLMFTTISMLTEDRVDDNPSVPNLEDQSFLTLNRFITSARTFECYVHD